MKKVILVDDQKVFRKSLTETLKTAGSVDIIGEASNGEEFLKLIMEKQPDLVFMDIQMPEMNGYELSSIVEINYPDIKIQLISGFTDIENIDLVNEGIKQNILHKPVNSKKLLSRIRSLLDS